MKNNWAKIVVSLSTSQLNIDSDLDGSGLGTHRLQGNVR